MDVVCDVKLDVEVVDSFIDSVWTLLTPVEVAVDDPESFEVDWPVIVLPEEFVAPLLEETSVTVDA